MAHEPFDESVEMYLKSIYELADDSELVPISALAQRLSVSIVSATEMIHRLGKRDLVEHTPYKGVALTATGRLRALRVIRRHRLWECFLVEHLGLLWERAHDHACQLEHATCNEVAESLATFLREPATCPHGNPIPDATGQTAAADDLRLCDWTPGESGEIARIYPESTLLLDYLAIHGIRPGVAITFDEVAPFNGPLMVTVSGNVLALGREIAANIYVRTPSS
jgi:DtxR family Mn-dependent transcriptional regulator